MPTLPDQGGVMPVLWQPTVQTSYGNLPPAVPASYTLNVITTQIIDKGVFLRFQIYDGQSETYNQALSASGSGIGLVEFDLVITTAIPAGTVCVVSITQTSTQLYGYTGTQIYASGGASVPAYAFGELRSCLCFAFVPTPAGSWFPCRGQPMFAIGFNHPDPRQGGTGETGAYCISEPTGVEKTAPNFPDQYAAAEPDYSGPRWTIEYEVVYPVSASYQVGPAVFGVPPSNVCRTSVGIKYLPIFTDDFKYGYSSTASLGSWTTARLNINQPWTVLKDNYTSVSRWSYYNAAVDVIPGATKVNASVGPFLLSAMAGQLVPVYWRPKYKDINTDNAPIASNSLVSAGKAGSPAAIGLLVTSPLYPYQVLYFTKGEYDAQTGGFGFRSSAAGGAAFVETFPSITWVVGNSIIEAGTVIYIGNLGTAGTYVQNAHDSAADVGVISFNNIIGESVTSLICLGVWDTTGNGSSKAIFQNYFVCAALSEQYAGNLPPLSPCITIHKNHFVGQVIYGMGRTFDNKGLPATVQAPLINSSTFTQLAWETPVVPSELPSFVGMCHFFW